MKKEKKEENRNQKKKRNWQKEIKPAANNVYTK